MFQQCMLAAKHSWDDEQQLQQQYCLYINLISPTLIIFIKNFTA
jgi:hypothetical protein